MTVAGFLSRLAHSRRRDPTPWAETLPGQRAFSKATESHRTVIVFGANGTGKTHSAASELVRVCKGEHPLWTRPIEILLCVTGWHSLSAKALAKILHRVAPAGLFGQQDFDEFGHPIGPVRPWYSPQRGFAGSPPRLVVLTGPMKGTQVDITTLGAGEGHAAGGTYHLVICDEPITGAMFNELQARGRGVSGCLWYLFTPTLNAPDQAWAKKLCDQKLAHLVQVELCPENLILSSGRPIEPWDETAKRIEGWDECEREMRCGRSWKPLMGNLFFSDVWRSSFIQPMPRGRQTIIAGVDHSTRAGRCRIVISGFTGEPNDEGRRLLKAHSFVDVRAMTANYEEVAIALFEAMDAAGLRLENIDYWIGDRVAMDRQLVHAGNMELRAAIITIFRRRGGKTTPDSLSAREFRQPKKKLGSHRYRQSYMKVMLAETRWLLDPACTFLADDIQLFDARDASPHKDGLDAFGYTLELAGFLTQLWLPRPD